LLNFASLPAAPPTAAHPLEIVGINEATVFVRSPWRYCPFLSPGGPPLPLAPPCNRQRPFSSPVTGKASRSWSALRTTGLSEIAQVDLIDWAMMAPSLAVAS